MILKIAQKLYSFCLYALAGAGFYLMIMQNTPPHSESSIHPIVNKDSSSSALIP